jgi:hypothetical protein
MPTWSRWVIIAAYWVVAFAAVAAIDWLHH